MPVINQTIEEFLRLAFTIPVLDVRSPGEYNHAHFPGAISFPIFTDDERKEIGTTYKQQSRERAIKTGLAYFGVNMVNMVEQAEEISSKNGGSKELLVHCWRGGMRSSAVAWLLSLYGFDITLLTGGYKAFRNWALQQFGQEYKLNVLGGYTGSGKTYVLHELQKQGKPVIDLEGLANHKGSAFGAIDMPAQPSQEMFENLLAVKLNEQKEHSIGEAIWVEDESQRIGRVNIPIGFWNQQRSSPLFFLNIEFEKRLQHIIFGYANGDKEQLANSITRIEKKLGGLETKNALTFLMENDFTACFNILLQYYDKLYTKGLHSRENLNDLLQTIPFYDVQPAAIALQLLALTESKIPAR